jgi:hypothetical protein
MATRLSTHAADALNHRGITTASHFGEFLAAVLEDPLGDLSEAQSAPTYHCF